MRWDPGHESPDVIDRRGERDGGGGGVGGLLFLVPWLLRTPGGWVVLLVVVAVMVGGAVWRGVLGGATDTGALHGGAGAAAARGAPAQDKEAQFVSFVLDDVQATWEKKLSQHGATYRHAKLVLFNDATRTACGTGDAASGPFYCPADERVYIDLGFYDELARRFGARGDFAQAYVVAHEIGHHVQKIMGISDRLRGASRSEQEGPTGASVRLELQADCFAGIWAQSTAERNLLEAGDVDEALGAAAAVGDDRLQRAATGVVHPEKWTHGSSQERSRWFKRGYEGGGISSCDTFSAKML